MATASSQLRLRYKDTPVFTGPRGNYYGLMEVPAEFEDYENPSTYTTYIVKKSDVGFPDLIAVKVYGPGCEDLWWVIAIANGIAITENMQAGSVLAVPPKVAVSSFLGRL